LTKLAENEVPKLSVDVNTLYV